MKNKLTAVVFIFVIICFMRTSISINTAAGNRMPSVNVPCDYESISIYKMKTDKDSIIFTSKCALYYPLNNTVSFGGCQYDIDQNPEYNTKQPSSEFRYIIGEYYTNLD